MIDDVDYADRAYTKHMRKASNTLLVCIERAKMGQPTNAPSGLATPISADGPPKQWCDYQIALLRKMRSDGLSINAMAEALERSRESVKDGIRRHLRGFDRNGNQMSGIQ